MGELKMHDSHWNLFVDNVELLLEKYERVDIKTMGFREKSREPFLRAKIGGEDICKFD